MKLSDTNYLTSPIIPFFFVLLFIHFCKKITRSTPTRKKLPPGPWKLPIIGSLHHLVGSSLLPHHLFRALAKKHGPIMHLQLGELSTVVISSAQLAKEVLKTHDLAVSNRPEFYATKIVMYKNLIFTPYGDLWKQMNKICILELLSAKKVKSFSVIRKEEVSCLIDSIRSMSEAVVDLGKLICSLLNTITCRAVFGSKCKNQDEILSIILELVEFGGGMDVSNLLERKLTARQINTN